MQFESGDGNTKRSLDLAFEDLSDGEKCFFICAVVLASNESYGPIFCFWDEPDNYLSLSETGHFVVALRKSFKLGGQLLVTSHNGEAIRRFSAENTILLHRRSHFEPTLSKLIENVDLEGSSLVDLLVRDELEL